MVGELSAGHHLQVRVSRGHLYAVRETRMDLVGPVRLIGMELLIHCQGPPEIHGLKDAVCLHGTFGNKIKIKPLSRSDGGKGAPKHRLH